MKKRLIIYSLSTTIALALWLIIMIFPQFKMKSEIGQSLNQVDTRLAEVQKAMASFPQELGTNREIKLMREIDLSRQYSREQLLTLFDQMRQYAYRENLAVLEISPSVEELLELNRNLARKKEFPQLNLTIRLNGSFRNLAQYIKNIESEEFYLGTNFCQIAAPTSGQGNPDMTYGFKAILGISRN
jgi:hypothetical protein